MWEEALARHCAPTLAGIKSGNLFTYAYRSFSDLLALLNEWNCLCKAKGIQIVILKSYAQKSLIYVYRPEKLKREWACPKVSRFLRERGYCPENLDQCIFQLSQKIHESDSFPHEIGLFLSYPLGDVIGFIENRGRNCKYCGCWKVYCDETACKKLFQQYKKCTEIYCSHYLQGVSILNLTVAA